MGGLMARVRTKDTTNYEHTGRCLRECGWAVDRWADPAPLTDAECERWSRLWETPDITGVRTSTGPSVFEVLVLQLVSEPHGSEVQRWRAR